MTAPHSSACLGSGLDPTLEPAAAALTVEDTGVKAESRDYALAEWRPAHRSNFTAGARAKIDRVVIHVTQGSYDSTLNWFDTESAQVSCHYTVRSRDGRVAQSVRESDTAWHAGIWSWNQRSVGIEHEGFVAEPKWFTGAMYEASARLCAHLCKRYRIPIDREHIVAHSQITPATRTDPGRFFDWTRYLSLVKKYAGQTTPPPPPPAGALEFVYAGYANEVDERVAAAVRMAFLAVGYKGIVMAGLSDITMQSKKVTRFPVGRRLFLAIGDPTYDRLHPDARAAGLYPGNLRSNVVDCVGASLAGTVEKTSWRVAEICRRLGLSSATRGKVLAVYHANTPGGTSIAPPGGVDLSRFAPNDKYGLTPHASRVQQFIQSRHPGITWVEGYRPPDTTEHETRKAIDFGTPMDDWPTIRDVALDLYNNRVALKAAGIIRWEHQIGYVSHGYSTWETWKPQWWQPPEGWKGDGWHRGHAHVLLLE